jgi:chromosome segregation ATPase
MAEAMDVCSGLRSLREALRSCEEALQAERVRAAVLKEKAERALSDQRAQMSRADTLFEQLQTERARSKQLRGRLAETTDRLDTALAERAGLVGVVDKIKFEIHELRQSQTDLTCSAREKGASLKLEVLQLKERLRQGKRNMMHQKAQTSL